MLFNECQRAVQVEMQVIYQLAFIRELAEGTLSRSVFDAYIAQDYLYLIDYARALALIGGRLHDCQQRQHMLALSQGCIRGEMAMQQAYLQQSLSGSAQPNAACFMYTNYLLRMAAVESVEEAIAAILPCLWVYSEVGRVMAAEVELDVHPYGDWIELYAGHEFQVSTQQTIELFNQLGGQASVSQQAAMKNAFWQGVYLERLFWGG